MSCFKTKLILSSPKPISYSTFPYVSDSFSFPLWLDITDSYQLSLFLPIHQSMANSFNASFEMSPPFIDFMGGTPQEINNVISLYKAIQKCYFLKWVLCPKTLMNSNCLENWNWTPWFHFQNGPSLFIFNILPVSWKELLLPPINFFLVHLFNKCWLSSLDGAFCGLPLLDTL